METMWRAIIQDMLEHMTPNEVANSLRKSYPEQPQLLRMVEQLSPTRSDMSTTVLGFCKKAQWKENDPDWWKPEESRDIPKSKIQDLMRQVKEHEEQETPEDIEREINTLQKERYSMLNLIDQHRSGNPPKGYSLEELIGLVKSIDETIAELRKRQQRKREAPSAEELDSMFKIEGLKGFVHKRAQMGSGFGYGNDGQTNFSVPNSEGEVGSGNPVDNTNETTPSSSYTDRLLSRMKVRREEEEEQKRRRKRKKLLKELGAQVKPGDLLKKKKTTPTSFTPTLMPDPGAAKEWKNVETEMKDVTEQAQTTTQKSDTLKKKTRETTDELKEQDDQMKNTTDDTKELAESSERASESAEKLRKSLERLVS